MSDVNDRPRRPVAAILGPTNTGKTHLAIERMAGHRSGVIGLPLRLLAREVYGRLVAKVGEAAVALVTGEERIKPPQARYWVSTVEAMPRDIEVDFVAVDEIQLAADLDRGHVFTDRLLHRRGLHETMLIGAETMRSAIEQLVPESTIVARPRLSRLSFAGERKLSRLPRRSAVVAFSAEDVYAIAEFLRRQRGGAAVVMGALSPRTRNAQVEMYQSGEVDFIVATDAIGMGLNLDVDHVAFASDRKFDGWRFRKLTPPEFAQIAGRAGRHLNDGTFGTTGRCGAFDEELIEALEDHRFEAVPLLQWRNADLDFTTIADLQASLDREPPMRGLTRAPLNEDVLVLDLLARDEQVQRAACTPADVRRLWESCQIPDYRKLSPGAHAELIETMFGFIVRAGKVPEDWFQRHLSMVDRADGEIDALSARIAHVRTYNFIANRPGWMKDAEHWQGVTRQVEDRLSDALHERLAHRFVDRRTSLLRRRLRENAMLEAEVTSSGDVMVEGQHVGALLGFRFTPDAGAEGEAQRTLNAAAAQVVATEIEARAKRVGDAVDDAFVLANDGLIRWLGEPIAKIATGDHILKPQARLLADERLTGPALEGVQRRLDLWLAAHVKKSLGPLFDLETGEGLEGLARGIAFQVAESLGVLERARVAQDIRNLDQAGRGALRKVGLRFGAYNIYLPQMLKPAPRTLAAQLWALRHGGIETVKGLDEVAHLASSGRTSFALDKDVPKGLYLAAGFRPSGERAVRVDMLERLADIIRPAIAYRPGQTPGDPPPGTADGEGFVVTTGMTSLVGCSGETFASILRSLGYHAATRPGPAITVPLVPKAATTPVAPAPSEAPAPAEAAEELAEELAEEPAEDAAPVDGFGYEADSETAVIDLPASAGDAAEDQAEPEAASSADEPAPRVDDEPAASAETTVAAPVDTDEPAPREDEPLPSSTDVEPVEETAVAAEGDTAGDAPSAVQHADAETATADASDEAASAEAAVADDAPTGEPVAEAPAAPLTIEVWSAHRKREPRRFDFSQVADQPDRPDRQPRRDRRPHRGAPKTGDQQPQGSDQHPQGGETAAEGVAAPDAAAAAQSTRPPRPEGPRRHQQGRGPHRPDQRRDGDRSFKQGGGQPKPFEQRPRPQQRQPDPNSPFAALAALKEQLEKDRRK